MRFEEFEFRRNLNNECEINPTIVKWKTDPDGKDYCFTILVFKRDCDGWFIQFIGDSALTVDNLPALWKLMTYGQAVLDAEFKLWS